MPRTPLALAALLAACGGAPPEDPPPSDPTVSLGQGYDAFAPLSPGDTMDVHLGPQGGYMIYVAYRATGLDPGDPGDPSNLDNPKVVVRATREDPDLFLGAITRRLGLRPLGDGLFEGLGTALVFRSGIPETDYLDQPFTLTATITDHTARSAEATLPVTAVFAGETDFLPP